MARSRLSVWTRFTIGLLLGAVGSSAALPEPPNQHQPWALPSGHGIPDYVVKVAATLFDAGLADPRGGSYRAVELPVPRHGTDVTQTHAWVFPGEFAVCWNGLVYRVRNVGAPADLDQDVRTIASAQPWSGRMTLRDSSDPNPAKAPFWYDLELNQTMAPASIALLLRLGRADQAALLWQASESSIRNAHEGNEAEWLATAAQAWFGTAYLRLVFAFERADDQAAIELAESIIRWESRVLADWSEPTRSLPDRIPDISFLKPVRALLADSQRRLEEPVRPELDDGKIELPGIAPKPQAARIADLIDRLEDVQVEKDSFPGQLLYTFHPVCEVLTKEGEAAVGSLLDAYEHDDRLTRTFDYSRPWSTAWTPIPVRHVAGILLGDILGDPLRIKNSTPAELRAWWWQHKSSDKAGRSFEVLADDQAGPERWRDAADFLTMRSDIHWAGDVRSTNAGACDPKKATPSPNGEALRTRQGPSLSELLAKRTAALVASNSDLACRLAVDAALWDPKTALPVLRTAATLKSCRANSLVAAARLSVGDADGAVDWAAEVRARTISPLVPTDQWSVIWMFPDDPVLQQTAEWLFARPESPASPALNADYVRSPLLTVPRFRRAVVAGLGDTKVVGSATRSEDGGLSFTTGRWGGLAGATSHDSRQAPRGQSRPIRVKDLIAWDLSTVQGAPKFELDWPDSDKDEIIAEIIAFLKLHENDLRAFPAQLQDTSCPGSKVYLER